MSKRPTGRLYGPFERRTEASLAGRLLRTDRDEAGEQAAGWRSGVGGADAPGQREFGKPEHGPNAESEGRVLGGGPDQAVCVEKSA